MALPIVIAKNQTASPIFLPRLGLTVPATPATITLTDFASFYEISWEAQLYTSVGAGDIVINDGVSDLSTAVALGYLDATGNMNGPVTGLVTDVLIRLDGTTGRYTKSTGITVDNSNNMNLGSGNITTTGTINLAGGVFIFPTAVAPTPTTEGQAVWDTDDDVLRVGTGSGTTTLGNVIGAASSTDNAAVRFDGTTGKLIQNSVVTIDDTGIVAGLAQLRAPSNLTVATEPGGGGWISIESDSSLDLTSVGAFDVNATGALTLDSSGGAISIGGDADAQAINVGTGAAARTITIGNITGATALVLNAGTGSSSWTLTGAGTFDLVAGTGAINLASNATDHSTTLGSTTGTSATTLRSGTGAFTVNAGGIWDINATGAVTIDGPGISIDGTAASNLSVTGAGLTLSTITSGTLAVTSAGALNLSGTTGDWQASGALTLDSSGGAIGIGTDADAQAINVGTGAAARTITIGNVTGATALVLNAGTGSSSWTLTGAGTFSLVAGTGAINFASNATDHSTTLGSTTGTSATTIQSGTGNLTLTSPDVRVGTILTTPNTGLHILDTNASHDLIIAPGSDLTADRTLTLTTGDVSRTIDITGAQGSIYYTDASGNFVALAPGTSGQFLKTNGAAANPSWAAAGDVVGPVSSQDNGMVRFDGITGKLIQDSTWVLNDAGSVTMSGTTGSIHAFIVSSSNSGIDLRGNRATGNTSADVQVRGQAARTMTSALFDVQNNATLAFRVRGDGAVLPAQIAGTSGIVQALVSGGVNFTGQTASTEAPFWHASTYTRTWATGAIATQREIKFEAPTYAFAGASTITDAANLYVEGAPIAGTNATITNTYALWVDSGLTRLDGTLQVADVQATAALTIDSTSTIGIGTDADAQAINIGSGAAARTITIGNVTGATALVLNAGTGSSSWTLTGAGTFDLIAGTGAINLASNATDHSTTLGSTTGTSATTLRSGTGAFTVNAGGIWDINATGAVTIDGPGISIDGTAASNLSVTGAGLTLSTITSGTLAVTSAGALNLSGTTGDWQASGALTLDSSGGAIGIGTDADAQAINVGTGAAARTITIGNITGATALVLNAGTGASSWTLTGAGTFSLVAGTGAVALASNATDHSTTLGSTTGTSATTIQSGTGNLTLTSPDVRVGTILTTPNTGLHILDTNASHDLIIAPGSDLTADRTLTLTTGDVSRTINITGAQGSIYYTDASGNLVALAPGTSGQFLKTNGAAANPAWDSPSGTGDVVGPASSQDNGVVRFDGTTGKLIQDSAITLSDTGGFERTAGNITLATITSGTIAVTSAGPLNLSGTTGDWQSTGAVTIDSSGGAIGIGTDANAQAINIGTGAAARSITIGNVTGATEVDINAGTGSSSWTLTGAGTFDLVAGTGAINLASNATVHATTLGSVTGASATTVQSGTGGLQVNSETTVNVLAITDLDLSGDTVSSTASGLNSIVSGAGAVSISAFGGIDITATGSATEDLTLTALGGNVDINAGGAAYIDAAGGFSIDGSGAASNLSTTSQNLTVSTLVSGVLLVDSAGALTLNASGTISIGNDADAQAIDVGTGAAARTITIGNSTGATALSLNVGTGNLNLGTNATAHTVVVGSTTGASAITEQTGTGAYTVNAGGIWDINATGAVTIDGPGISIDGTAASNLSVTGAGLTLSTITSGTLAVTSAGALNLSGTTGDWQASGALTLDSSGGAISIGGDADAQAINVGTGAAARTITIGNSTGATALVLNAGTGSSSWTLTGAGTFSLVAGTGAVALASNATDHSTTLGSTTGTSATTIQSGTGNLTLTSPDVRVGTILTTPNTGLHILDTNASHDLIIAPGSDLTADRTLTLTTGDVSRTIDITGAQGSIYYTDASGNLVALAPGTSGQYLKTNGAAANPSWATVSGSGDVVGPASSQDNGVVRFDGTTGKLIQDSSVTISDTGVIANAGTGASLGATNTNTPLILAGNRNAGVTTSDVEITSSLARTLGALLAVQNSSVDVFRVRYDGALLLSMQSRTSGTASAIGSIGTNHTGQTASTEIPNWQNTAYSRQWATGAITTQREIKFEAPTYAFVGASTITDAANLYVEGAPIAGTNATITNAYALWVDSGTSRFDGAVQIPNTGLQVYDTDSSHFLSIVPGSNLTAARTLTLTTGDASRTINITGAQGSIYYTDASGNLVALAPGTSGQVLQTNGAAANPSWATASGGGGAGTTTVDFGSAAAGSQQASTDITGQTSILGTSKIKAWVTATATADHNAAEHTLVPFRVVVRDIVAGTGFTIQVISDWHLNGTFTVQWEWV